MCLDALTCKKMDIDAWEVGKFQAYLQFASVISKIVLFLPFELTSMSPLNWVFYKIECNEIIFFGSFGMTLEKYIAARGALIFLLILKICWFWQHNTILCEIIESS